MESTKQRIMYVLLAFNLLFSAVAVSGVIYLVAQQKSRMSNAGFFQRGNHMGGQFNGGGYSGQGHGQGQGQGSSQSN